VLGSVDTASSWSANACRPLLRSAWTMSPILSGASAIRFAFSRAVARLSACVASNLISVES
jgi:hypothetical protein